MGGIRVSSSHAWVVEGDADGGPDAMEAQCPPVAIPLAEEHAGAVSEFAAMLTRAHPELAELLDGRISFADASSTREVALEV
jgi:hypothetical protein